MQRFNECLSFNDIIYNFDRYSIEEALEFIQSTEDMTLMDVCNQIMLGMKNNFHVHNLIELAKSIGEGFITSASVVKSNYWAKVLVEEGIPISAFQGYNEYEIMSISTEPSVT